MWRGTKIITVRNDTGTHEEQKGIHEHRTEAK